MFVTSNGKTYVSFFVKGNSEWMHVIFSRILAFCLDSLSTSVCVDVFCLVCLFDYAYLRPFRSFKTRVPINVMSDYGEHAFNRHPSTNSS
jgi:hypothetical protein